MTRRQLLADSLKWTGLLAGGLGLLAGCEGGDTGGTDQAKISPERQAELDKQRAASEAFAKEHAKKK